MLPGMGLRRLLINSEVYFNIHFDRHRPAVQGCRFELVLPHSTNRLLVQPHAQMTHDVNPLRIALGIHDERD